MLILNCEQGSEDWFKTRLGIPTASEFSKIITPAKGDYSSQSAGYMHKLIAERITGKEATGFMSDWMERGKDMEAEARSWYEFKTDKEVKQVGFVYQDERKLFGCSPDGLVSDTVGLEIKCVSPGVMVGYMLDGKLPREYIPQVQGSLLITGMNEWEFLVYHPDFDPILITVQRDEEYIEKMGKHLARFIKELNAKLEQLNG